MTAKRAVDEYLNELGAVAPQYLAPADAATYLGLSAKLLEAWRGRGEGPPYTKLDRAVRYNRADLDEWMTTRRVAR
ncbi:MAG: helix-turn-helix domain-containing protein [Pseudomonadota bacterium]